MRDVRSLAGEWRFQPDFTGEITLSTLAPSRSIQVPMPWQAQFEDLQRTTMFGWYQRSISVDESWLAGEVLLHFGAVDYWCEVFVNGARVGQHEGGYTPFVFRVRSVLRAGDNDLVVRVYDPIQTGSVTQRHPQFPQAAGSGSPPFNAIDIPHGKQEWYISVGGIWQDVTLTAVPQSYIEHVRVVGMLDGTVEVTVRLNGETGETVDLSVLRDGVEAASLRTRTDGNLLTARLHVDNPTLWSLENPALYTLRVRLGRDEVTTRFGFREVSTRGGKIHLNGEPVYLVAALDQDFYPETIYTVPSEAYLRDEFMKARHLGLNCLRCHIKPPDPIYLDLADEMGLLVWAEIPSWRTFYPKGTAHLDQLTIDDALKERVETTLREMIARDFNHPSLIIWTIVNEDWGTALPLSGGDRTWVRELYDLCKVLDPTRLVVDNSPCPTPWGPSVHVKSDLDDWHVYANIPDHAESFWGTINALNMRALWTYSQHGDSERRGDEPIIVSEFGNWGLAALQPYLDETDGQEPTWFDLGPWWSSWEGEPGWMRGVLERFRAYGLDKVFGDFSRFATATQWHQYHALKYQIEAMRRLPNITGYVITELTDIYWEGNGLLDFARRPKAFHDVFAQFNTPDVVVPYLPRHAYWDDERIRPIPYFSRYTGRDWTGAQLQMVFDGETYTQPLGDVTRGDVHSLPMIPVNAPIVDATSVVPMAFEVTGADGEVLAANTAQVLILPSRLREPGMTSPVAVIEGAPMWMDEAPYRNVRLTERTQGIGYAVRDRVSSATPLALTSTPTPELMEWTANGGSLLYLYRGGGSPFFWAQSRGGTYGGSWMTAWTWLRPGVHTRLDFAGLNPLSVPFIGVMPQFAILGLPVEAPEYQSDFLAGQITGWVNHPAVHTVQFRYGRGTVVMTTFNLVPALGQHPAATAMLHDLVDYIASGRCQPTLQTQGLATLPV